MDNILALALVTFVLLVGFLLWNRMSVKKNQETGGNTAGIGGPNDPLSGVAEGMRHPDEMRADLNAASKVDVTRRATPSQEALGDPR